MARLLVPELLVGLAARQEFLVPATVHQLPVLHDQNCIRIN
jgi:hypothetical protein